VHVQYGNPVFFFLANIAKLGSVYFDVSSSSPHEAEL
jgi:hypothetical protein